MAILSKCISQITLNNSLKLIFKNIGGFFEFLRSSVFEAFHESNSLDILALCEANMDDWIDSVNFSVRILAISLYFPFIQKDSVTHMHGLPVYVKKGHPFTKDLSLENSICQFLFIFLTGFTYRWFEVSFKTLLKTPWKSKLEINK